MFNNKVLGRFANAPLLVLGVFLGLGCSTVPPAPSAKQDVIHAKTTSRDAKKGETFEEAPVVENAARSEKEKLFLEGQKAYDLQDYPKAIAFLSTVVNDSKVGEMNYFAASLLFDALAKEKKYPELCSQCKSSATLLCGSDSSIKPDQLEFCKDLYNILDSCSK